MGLVVDKTFSRVRKDIGKKANKILVFLETYPNTLGLPGYNQVDWSKQQNSAYEKLAELCCDLADEVNNLDEIEVPEYKKVK